MIVMAIAQVNCLKFASRDNALELPIHSLTDPTAKVDTQIPNLQQATLEDDPTEMHDWSWFSRMGSLCNEVSGQYVQPINPSISIHQPGKPLFLFESDYLITLLCNLFQELSPQDWKTLLKVKQSEDFPYRSSGMLPDFSVTQWKITLHSREGMFHV